MKENTIWLRKLIIMMLNTESSALSVSFRYLCRLFSCSSGAIYLRELAKDAQETKLIYVENGKACMYPVPEKDREGLLAAVSMALQAEKPLTQDRSVAIPLGCSSADDFGVLFLEAENRDWDDKKQEAVSAFSQLIYANAMGGFLKSVHPAVLQVRDVIAKYDRKNPDAPAIVNRCSFDINAGELTVIMGHSGGGKSTLLNIIGGLMKPVSGEVLWKGKNICTMNRTELDAYHRDALGFIFQNYNLIQDLNAEENVSVAAVLTPGSKEPGELLTALGLGHRLNYHPGQMSGGEQQRVCIARALVKNPEILLCDEPTGALDTENTRNIMAILQRITREQNIPVVVVTHNPEFVVLADHYILIKDGRIEKDDYQPFPFQAEEVLQ